MSVNKRKALLSQLKRLMVHILKWFCQPDKQSSSWELSINDSRGKIARLREEAPSLNGAFIKENWSDCEEKARKDAARETGKDTGNIPPLTPKQVFEDKYKRTKG